MVAEYKVEELSIVVIPYSEGSLVSSPCVACGSIVAGWSLPPLPLRVCGARAFVRRRALRVGLVVSESVLSIDSGVVVGPDIRSKSEARTCLNCSCEVLSARNKSGFSCKSFW